jgi:hypothetical protein
VSVKYLDNLLPGRNDLDRIRRDVGYLRPRTILESGFKTAWVLDADAYPVVNPSYLFEDAERHGAVFWREHPDGDIFIPERYGLHDYASQQMPQVQGGSYCIDVTKCYTGLELVQWLNDRRDHWFQHALGDQTQWRAAWLLLNLPRIFYSREPVEHSKVWVFNHQGRDGKSILLVHRTGCKLARDGAFSLPLKRYDDLPLESMAWDLRDEALKLIGEAT